VKVEIGPYTDDSEDQVIKVKIDNYDTWNMDHTLAYIVLPLLKQLKETKNGAPTVDPKDVPINLRPPKKDVLKYKELGETDPDFFKRWDWILDEMIYAFNCKVNSENNMKKEQDRISNGFKLFGKYYEALWD